MRIQRPLQKILCTELASDGKAEDYEGILVLIAPRPVPEIDEWMTALKKRQGSTGVSVDDARKMFAPAMRGGSPNPPPRDRFFTPEELEQVRRGNELLAAQSTTDPMMKLPNIEEHWIECRVTGK
jgi:hypothetical protein